MNPLETTVSFHEGETIMSFMSRLAHANYVDLREFSNDMGLNLQKIVKGDDLELERLAALSAMNQFPPDHVVKRDEYFHHINGDILSRACFLRARLRYCPHCIADDVVRGSGHPKTRPYMRLNWAVTFIRVCEHHNVMLREIEPSRMDGHDIVPMIEAELARPDFRIEATVSPTTPFERYVTDRLWGRCERLGWLDQLPLYAAGKMCETVGATILHGKTFLLTDIDEPGLRDCAQAGFEVLIEGEEAFREFLRALLNDFWKTNGPARAKKLYGRLYERLAHETEDAAYDSVREIMREEALNAIPFGVGEDLFGPNPERRLHSIHSAAAEFKVNRKTLQKWAVAAGIVPIEALNLSPDRVTVDSKSIADLAKRYSTRMFWNQAVRYLDIPQTFGRTLFWEGYIPLGVEIVVAETGVNPFYLQTDIDAFVERLKRCITLPFDSAAKTSTFTQTIKRANCSFREIIELLLDGALLKVTLDPAARGLAAFRFDLDEVKSFTRLPDHGGLSVSAAAATLRISDQVLKKLIAHKVIDCEEARNPVTRNIQTIVTTTAIEKFNAEYIALSRYAAQRGKHIRVAYAELTKLGIAPTPPREAVRQIFYRRCELP